MIDRLIATSVAVVGVAPAIFPNTLNSSRADLPALPHGSDR